jgi:hypothetical protein
MEQLVATIVATRDQFGRVQPVIDFEKKESARETGTTSDLQQEYSLKSDD